MQSPRPFDVLRRVHLLPLVAALFGVLALSLPLRAQQAERVEWQAEWRRVGLLEGLSLIPLTAAVATVAFAVQPPEEPRWRGGIWFDSAVRDVFRGRTRDVQSTATTVGDILYMGGAVAPILIDLGVALAVHRKPDVAWQMFLIDFQSIAVAGLLSVSTQHTVARGRPYSLDCDEEGVVLDVNGEPFDNACGGARTSKSFFSGHAAITAAVAGVTCIHHQHLPLYGGGFADLAPCVLMIGASVGTGVARMVSDVHWASDVLLGWGIGALAGYVLPAAIHYGFGDWREERALRAWPVARVVDGGGEFGVIGRF